LGSAKKTGLGDWACVRGRTPSNGPSTQSQLKDGFLSRQGGSGKMTPRPPSKARKRKKSPSVPGKKQQWESTREMIYTRYLVRECAMLLQQKKGGLPKTASGFDPERVWRPSEGNEGEGPATGNSGGKKTICIGADLKKIPRSGTKKGGEGYSLRGEKKHERGEKNKDTVKTSRKKPKGGTTFMEKAQPKGEEGMKEKIH